jgi:tRNA-dihydrouridine synthase B
MIGRWAIGNPWIFGEVKAAIEGRAFEHPTPQERVTRLLAHVGESVRNDGEPIGLVATRRAMSGYLKHVPRAKEIRSSIMACTSYSELEDILGSFLRDIDRGVEEAPAGGAYRAGVSLS